MKNTEAHVRLLSFVGHHDRDILPFFLAHYRTLGVSGFVLALHGPWPESSLDWLTRQDDVAVWDLLGDRYEEFLSTFYPEPDGGALSRSLGRAGRCR